MIVSASALSGFVSAQEAKDSTEAVAIVEIKKLGGVVRSARDNRDLLEIEFHLRGRNLTDKGLRHVGQLKNVVFLNLKNTRISNAGLVHLKGLSKLRWLHLERTKIDDNGIKHLAELKNLEYLNLYGTKVTDKSLTVLSQLKKLKRLYVWQTKVTPKGVAMLQASRAHLKVYRGVDLSKLPSQDTSTVDANTLKRLEWNDDLANRPAKSKLGSNTSITFQNKSKQTVKVVWVGYGGELKFYATLKPGASREQNTYSEAVWLITDANDDPLGYFEIGSERALAVIP
jgi:hypothetical protein